MQQNWCLWVSASRSCRSPVSLRMPRWSPWTPSLRTTLSGVALHGLAEETQATTHDMHPLSSRSHAYVLTGMLTLPSSLKCRLCCLCLVMQSQLASLRWQIDVQFNLQALQGWRVRVHPVSGHSGLQQAVDWQRSNGRSADTRLLLGAASCAVLRCVLCGRSWS